MTMLPKNDQLVRAPSCTRYTGWTFKSDEMTNVWIAERSSSHFMILCSHTIAWVTAPVAAQQHSRYFARLPKQGSIESPASLRDFSTLPGTGGGKRDNSHDVEKNEDCQGKEGLKRSWR